MMATTKVIKELVGMGGLEPPHSQRVPEPKSSASAIPPHADVLVQYTLQL